MAMMGMMNPGSYQAFMNPSTYLQWMNPSVYNMGGTNVASFMNPGAWTNMMAPQQQQAEQQPQQ